MIAGLPDDVLSFPGSDQTAPPPASLRLPEFPFEILPSPLQNLVLEGAATIGVPTDLIAMPLLGFAAATVGNTLQLTIKRGMTARLNFWMGMIGEPGSGKSPALELARQALDPLQQGAWHTYQLEREEWDRATRDGRHAGAAPRLAQFYTTDATREAIASILAHSPGVAMVRDELVAWVSSFDAYRKAGDRQDWLSLWAGTPIKVDRKGGQPIYITEPNVVVVGGIQPGLLHELRGAAAVQDGFLDRFDFVWPEAPPLRWTDDEIGERTIAHAVALFRLLRPADAQARRTVTLSDGARRRFAHWYDENVQLAAMCSGLAAGMTIKLGVKLSRYALLLHALNWPGDPTSSPISERTMLDAIELVEYLRAHAGRVLVAFKSIGAAGSAGLWARIERLLMQAATATDPWLSRTDINKRLGNATSNDIRDTLRALKAEGLVDRRDIPTGRRPREEWCWRPLSPAILPAHSAGDAYHAD